ncbi:MAG: DUF1002 domain-containing protein [Roseburia sp.]
MKRYLAGFCMAAIILTMVPQNFIYAENVTGELVTDEADDHVVIEEEDRPYLALGANLTAEQQQTVLDLMGIDSSQLDQYDVVYVTNEEEHTYLDQYISSSQIGTKSLSSVVIVKKGSGNGINISTKNINYCTVGMYKNALVTAGIEDADIIVAAPQPISGTAALVGVFKAYQEITGEEIPQENVDTALNELVLTGELGEALGENTEVEGLIAYIKQRIAEEDLDSDDQESINAIIDDACQQFDVELTESQREEVLGLAMKLSDLDLDVDSLKEQAQSVYDKLAELDIDTDQIAEKASGFFAKLWEKIKSFFSQFFD